MQSGKQTADADGNAGGGHPLAGEARHQIVIAAAAGDGAKHDFLARFIGDGAGQLTFPDRTGVIVEPAHHASVEHHPVGTVAGGREQLHDRFELVQPFGADLAGRRSRVAIWLEMGFLVLGVGACDKGQHALRLVVGH